MLDEHLWTTFSSLTGPTYHHHGVLVNGRTLVCNDSQIDNCVKECTRQFTPLEQRDCVTAVEAKWGHPAACFSGDASVFVKGAGCVKMRDLRLADLVLDTGFKYSRVIGWLHRDDEIEAEFLLLKHQNGQLVVTGDHLLYCADRNEYLPANLVNGVQSIYLDGTMCRSRVLSRQSRIERGIYAPLTNTGTILVNGVHSSCYASPTSLAFPLTQTLGNIALWPFQTGLLQSSVLQSYCLTLFESLRIN